jgi:uncharacterized membrane protein
VNNFPSPVPNFSLDLRLLTHVVYGLFASGYMTFGLLGAVTLVSVVVMYIKRADVAGTVYASHFDWLLRTFWWALLFLAISAVFTLIYIGYLGVLATVVWVVYRFVKGWLALLEGASLSPYD